MTERGLPLCKAMVLAALDGRKTQTGRVMRPQPPRDWQPDEIIGATPEGWADYRGHTGKWSEGGDPENKAWRSRYRVGDIIYIQEALVPRGNAVTGKGIVCTAQNVIETVYEADGCTVLRDGEPVVWPWKVRGCLPRLPSIFCPKWAARPWRRRIVEVRPERVQSISEADAEAEGVCRWHAAVHPWIQPQIDWVYRTNYAVLWDTLHPLPSERWAADPWVWVVRWEDAA